MTLNEAREKQSKIQKKVILKFALYLSLIGVLVLSIYFFSNLFVDYPALWTLPIVLLFVAVKYSNVLGFLNPKEFIGTVKYCNINIEMQKKYASGQAGVTYASYDVAMMEIIAINEKGRKLSRSYQCRGDFGEFKEGQKVAMLRFIDVPIGIWE